MKTSTNIYTIRVESSNPEFTVDSDLREGVQADGYVLLTVRNGEPYMEAMNGLSTLDLAKFFDSNTEACSVLRQAAAIGEGMHRASEIRLESEGRIRRDRIAKEITEKIMGMNLTGTDEN